MTHVLSARCSQKLTDWLHPPSDGHDLSHVDGSSLWPLAPPPHRSVRSLLPAQWPVQNTALNQRNTGLCQITFQA